MHTCANTVHKHTSSYTNHTPRVPTKAKGELGGLQAKEEEQPYDPVLFDPMRCEQPAALTCLMLNVVSSGRSWADQENAPGTQLDAFPETAARFPPVPPGS